ncbi:hypothetical protein, partial [Sphingobacterium sp.]|uniref:hypothetical protein n=1 Tax=Sphingobacterium sp. TaxID=341027 RepID=UPI00289E50F8
MRKSIYSLFILLLMGHLVSAQQLDNSKSVDKIIALMNQKNAPALLALMADSASIGNLPKMNNKVAIPEILAKFSTIKAFQIVHQNKLPNGDELIQVEVTYQDGKPGKPNFLFNKDGQITNLGIIKGRVKADPEKALADAVVRA